MFFPGDKKAVVGELSPIPESPEIRKDFWDGRFCSNYTEEQETIPLIYKSYIQLYFLFVLI